METNLSKTILRVIKEQEYSSSNDEKDNPKTNGNFCKLISLLFHSITQVHTIFKLKHIPNIKLFKSIMKVLLI